jgi:carbon monoxide dehydrogenase subunit G
MDMLGERRIPAPRGRVWEALNDTDVLQQSIPGCQEMTRHSPTDISAKVAVKIGPVNANFAAKVQLSDIDAPNGYTITGEGNGGVAGFAKGGAKVRLSDDGPDATLLAYEVHAQVGGKIAQLGARLIDSSAKQMSDQFFDRFTAVVTAREAPEAAATAAPLPQGGIKVSLLDLVPQEPFGYPRIVSIGVGTWLVIMAMLFLFAK